MRTGKETMPDRRCALPGCGAPLYARNTTGVCRDHMHRSSYCQCRQCRGERPRYRPATRRELIDKGLLPLATGAKPSRILT